VAGSWQALLEPVERVLGGEWRWRRGEALNPSVLGESARIGGECASARSAALRIASSRCTGRCKALGQGGPARTMEE
jgi:hypothetical protein